MISIFVVGVTTQQMGSVGNGIRYIWGQLAIYIFISVEACGCGKHSSTNQISCQYWSFHISLQKRIHILQTCKWNDTSLSNSSMPWSPWQCKFAIFLRTKMPCCVEERVYLCPRVYIVSHQPIRNGLFLLLPNFCYIVALHKSWYPFHNLLQLNRWSQSLGNGSKAVQQMGINPWPKGCIDAIVSQGLCRLLLTNLGDGL